MSKINTSAAADARKVRTGKDGGLFNANGKLLASMETFQSQLNATNAKYQPLGSYQEHEVPQSYALTLVFTETVIEDTEFISDLMDAIATGTLPEWNFQGYILGANGSEERVVYRQCIPSGNVDIQNLTAGDTIKRQWNLFVNDEPSMPSKLTA